LGLSILLFSAYWRLFCLEWGNRGLKLDLCSYSPCTGKRLPVYPKLKVIHPVQHLCTVRVNTSHSFTTIIWSSSIF
jgi:hypothetical protein